MILAVKFLSEAVVSDSYLELLGVVTLLTILGSALTWYRHSRCHNSDCRNCLHLRRHGKYPHGHLSLCHVHKPGVPDDGRITQEHIDAVTRSLLTASQQVGKIEQ